MLGVVALAAISVQFIARRAVNTGLRASSYAVFCGDAAFPCVRPGCSVDKNGDGVCDCDDSNRDGECDASTSDSTQTSTETGLGGGQRQTVLAESGAGQAEGEHVRLREMDPGRMAVPRPPPGPREPPDTSDQPKEKFP